MTKIPAPTRLRLFPPRHALPRRVRPYLDETTASYLDRLARANHLDTENLRRYLTGDQSALSAPVDTGALAILTGLPELVLRHAILELSSPEQLACLGSIPGRPNPHSTQECVLCRRCAATRGERRIKLWQTHENVICLRHLLWTRIRLRDSEDDQIDLRDYPEVSRANRLHRRLIRRYGRAPVHAAFECAERICSQWHREWYRHRDGISPFLGALRGDAEAVLVHDPAVAVATYRQKVALTRLLASPGWSGLILGDHPGTRPQTIGMGGFDLHRIDEEIRKVRRDGEVLRQGVEQDLLREAVVLRGKPNTRLFVEEIRRTVAREYVWLPFSSNGRCEPLAEWVKDQILARTDSYGRGVYWPPLDEVYTVDSLRGPAVTRPLPTDAGSW